MSSSGANIGSSAPTPGTLLRGCREQSGLPQQEAARLANLGASIVSAIENDDYAALGLPVYARGYYRRYAKVVGCEPEIILRAYEDVTQTPSPVPVITQRPSIPYGPSPLQKPLLVAGVVIVLVALIGYLYWPASNSDSDARSQLSSNQTEETVGAAQNPPIGDAKPTPTLMVMPAIRKPVVADMANAGKRLAGTELGSSGSTATSGPASQSLVTPVSSTPPQPARGTPPNRLEIVVGSEEAWIDVTDALGERLSYRTASAGETLRFDGEPPYGLNLGRAYGLRVSYGGVVLDLSKVIDDAGRARATIAANGELIPR